MLNRRTNKKKHVTHKYNKNDSESWLANMDVIYRISLLHPTSLTIIIMERSLASSYDSFQHDATRRKERARPRKLQSTDYSYAQPVRRALITEILSSTLTLSTPSTRLTIDWFTYLRRHSTEDHTTTVFVV